MVAGVEVVDRFAGDAGDRELACRAAAAARTVAGRADLAVTVLLTDDAEIAHLHALHLGDSSPTDVMSFVTDDGVEVVVSVEWAERTAGAHAAARAAEVALYVAHGVLHACGHDDQDADARARMRAAERAALALLGMHVERFE